MAHPSRGEVHINTPLTTIAQAYRNTTYLGARWAFPEVAVAKISDLYWIYDKAEWFQDIVSHRAPGTRAKSGDYYLSTGSYLCLEWAISKIIPDEVRENADAPLVIAA